MLRIRSGQRRFVVPFERIFLQKNNSGFPELALNREAPGGWLFQPGWILLPSASDHKDVAHPEKESLKYLDWK
jgi:hypothetical protein